MNIPVAPDSDLARNHRKFVALGLLFQEEDVGDGYEHRVRRGSDAGVEAVLSYDLRGALTVLGAFDVA